ncbi:MAG TPA: NAD(P)/FAD-dependent oxidoreductase, partial [Planctomycetes bacterium]|nr:NAD(P)/FAD-dependent oxidoreductase [Planctomycetota bacterium]
MWPAGYDKDPARIATSDNLLDWETLPKSLLIVGAGLVSCEYAFILNSLGVDVTILVRGDRVMSFLDGDISAIVLREMRKRKIAIKTLNEVERLAVTED